ncbi:MAG: Hsp70 family protein [Bacteroidota bacterium]
MGIDYGTSTCKLAYASPPLKKGGDPVVKNFSFSRFGTDASPRFPSSIVFDGSRKRQAPKVLAGFEAERMLEKLHGRGGDVLEFVMSPKMDLGEGIVYPFAPMEFSEPCDLCALTLDSMVKAFEKKLRTRRSRCRFLVTVPSSFSSTQREELIEALNRIGIVSMDDLLVDEPNAAFLGLTGYPAMYAMLRGAGGGHLLIVDFGAGTCDLSVLKIRDDPTNDPFGVNLTNIGINDFARLGGNDIDRAVAEEVLESEIGDLAAAPVDELTCRERQLRQISLSAKRLKEFLLDRGHLLRKRKSRDDVVRIGMMGTLQGRTRAKNVHYSGKQLAGIIDGILGRTGGDRISLKGLIHNVLGKARIAPEAISAVLLAGGSARLFEESYFRSFFLEMFPGLAEKKLIYTDDHDLLVSRGAAVECLYRHHLRRSLIRPICPGDIGVRTAEGLHRVLLPAGTSLPAPNQEDERVEERLFVPDPKPSTMRIPIAVRRFGEWVTVETWLVMLPAEFRSNEPLIFHCSMTKEKILKVEFRSDVRTGESFSKTCTRWLHGKEPTPRENRVNGMRQRMKEQVGAGGELAPATFIALVKEEYEAGMYDTVRSRCEYLIQNMGDRFSARQLASLWNLYGLASEHRLDVKTALSAYRKAADLSPTDWVFNYNVGVTYLWSYRNRTSAVPCLRKAVECQGAEAAAWYWYGRVLEEGGDQSESRICFNRAWDMLSRGFSGDGNVAAIRLFRDVCDKLGLAYPDGLREALSRPARPEPEDCQESLFDNGDIVRYAPVEA